MARPLDLVDSWLCSLVLIVIRSQLLSELLHRLRLGLILFNNLISDLGDWMECILSKFT